MPHNRLFSYLLILTFLFLQSCANYRMNYSKAVQNWEAEAVIPPTSAPVEHTDFLLGDAGHLPHGEVAPALKLLRFQRNASFYSVQQGLGKVWLERIKTTGKVH